MFDVTWYNDTIQQWDAIIKDGTTDIHAYAIMSITFDIVNFFQNIREILKVGHIGILYLVFLVNRRKDEKK